MNATFTLTDEEVFVVREALRCLWHREYPLSLGPRGGWKPTKTLSACEELRAKFGDYDDDNPNPNTQETVQ